MFFTSVTASRLNGGSVTPSTKLRRYITDTGKVTSSAKDLKTWGMQSLRLLEVLLSRPRRGDLQGSGIIDPAIPTFGSTFQQGVTGTTIPSRSATAKHRRLRPTWHGPTNRMLRPWSLPIRSLTGPPKSPRWDHPNYSKRRVERFLKVTREYRIVVNILQILFVLQAYMAH